MKKNTTEEATPELGPQKGINPDLQSGGERSRKLVCNIGEGIFDEEPTPEILSTSFIEQLDGHPNEDLSETVYDLTISSASFLDTLTSIEENLCTNGNGDMIEFIDRSPSKEEADPEIVGKTLHTTEIRIRSDQEFIEKIEKIFKLWCSTWFANKYGNPRGKLVKFKKKSSIARN